MTTQRPPRDDVEMRIDTYLNADVPENATNPDQQVVQRLARYYQLPEEHELVLKRVQIRLQRAQHLLSEEEALTQMATLPGQLSTEMSNVSHNKTRRRFSRRLSLLAAVIALALLCGSVLVVSRPQASQAPATVHVHNKYKPAPTQSPTRLYMLAPQIGGPTGPGGSSLIQIDPDSGKELWTFALKRVVADNGGMGSCFSPPTTVGDMLYFEGSDTNGTTLYALNASSGTLHWKTLLTGACSHLALADGLVFAVQSTTTTSHVEAFNADTGAQVWSQEEQSSEVTGVDTLEVIGVRQGVLYLENVLLAQQQTILLARQTRTGAKLWQQNIPHVATFMNAIIVDHLLYLAGGPVAGSQQASSTLFAFDLTTGTQLWSTGITGSIYLLTADKQRVYASTLNKDHYGEIEAGSVYVLRASDGAITWQQHPNQEVRTMQVVNGEMYLGLIVPGSAVYSHTYKDKDGTIKTAVDGPNWHLQALAASTGQLIWQQSLPASVDGLLIYHANLYLTDSARTTIDVLSGASGQQITTLPIPGTGSGWPMGIEMFLA